jgi:hypothetical protein
LLLLSSSAIGCSPFADLIIKVRRYRIAAGPLPALAARPIYRVLGKRSTA